MLTVEITERVPFADGASFAGTGPYERLTGRVRFRVDPRGAGAGWRDRHSPRPA